MSNANKSFFWVFLPGILTAVAALLSAAPPPINPKDGLEHVWIPAGSFQMGCVPRDRQCDDDEKPRHRVEITNFWMNRTEVTVAAYKRFKEAQSQQMPPPPRDFNPNWGKDDHPIVSVQWRGAAAYCAWAGGRLPTEAEWEYAARGGKEGLIYPGGNKISSKNAKYDSDGTAPVGSYPANGFGLYDMVGNVWEWCSDPFDGSYYDNSPAVDPQGPLLGRNGEMGVVRGGGWDSNRGSLRVSVRASPSMDLGYKGIGFRCAGEVSP